jgi:hypothetical protein
MSDPRKNAPTNAATKTSQDAPGTTIGTWGDLRVNLISAWRIMDEVFMYSFLGSVTDR